MPRSDLHTCVSGTLRQYFRKADLFLLLGLLALGALSLVAVRILSGAAVTVDITVNGAPYGSYDLSVDRTVEIDTEYGHNTVVIRNGAVSVTESDCSGQDCVGFGEIRASGGVIMCLPHRLIVTVTDHTPGADGEQVDAVVY